MGLLVGGILFFGLIYGYSHKGYRHENPPEGVAVWTGALKKDGTLAIAGATASVGTLQGAGLPGTPVRVTIDEKDVTIAQQPAAANGYQLVLKSLAPCDKITVRWAIVH